jgi:serine/threonine protein kinase
MYEALTRSLPFLAPDRSADAPSSRRYPQLDSDPFEPPKDVPAPVAELLLWCLERKPSDRPTAFELARALEPMVASLPAPRLGLFRPGGRPARDAGDWGERFLSRSSRSSHPSGLLLSSVTATHREGGTR